MEKNVSATALSSGFPAAGKDGLADYEFLLQGDIGQIVQRLFYALQSADFAAAALISAKVGVEEQILIWQLPLEMKSG